jgi:homoserine O-acetyltransferase/O-succinyltransferase
MVNAHELLRRHLGIEKIHTVIGGSTGGHQALEWTIMHPGLHDHLICIANHAKASPWSIAFSQSQRLAIEADHSWKENRPDAGQGTYCCPFHCIAELSQLPHLPGHPI